MYNVCSDLVPARHSFFLLCSALAPQHTLQITLQIQYTSCVFWVWFFSVNFNVDMYLVLRSPISRR